MGGPSNVSCSGPVRSSWSAVTVTSQITSVWSDSVAKETESTANKFNHGLILRGKKDLRGFNLPCVFSLSVSPAPPCWLSVHCRPGWKDLISVRTADINFIKHWVSRWHLSLTSSSIISAFFPFFPTDSSSSSSSSSSSLSSSSSSSSSLSPSFLLHLFLLAVGLTDVLMSSPPTLLSLFPVFLAWMLLSLWRQKLTVSLSRTCALQTKSGLFHHSFSNTRSSIGSTSSANKQLHDTYVLTCEAFPQQPTCPSASSSCDRCFCRSHCKVLDDIESPDCYCDLYV